MNRKRVIINKALFIKKLNSSTKSKEYLRTRSSKRRAPSAKLRLYYAGVKANPDRRTSACHADEEQVNI